MTIVGETPQSLFQLTLLASFVLYTYDSLELPFGIVHC